MITRQSSKTSLVVIRQPPPFICKGAKKYSQWGERPPVGSQPPTVYGSALGERLPTLTSIMYYTAEFDILQGKSWKKQLTAKENPGIIKI